MRQIRKETRPTHYMYRDEAGEWQFKESDWYRQRNQMIDRTISIVAILLGTAALVLRIIS